MEFAAEAEVPFAPPGVGAVGGVLDFVAQVHDVFEFRVAGAALLGGEALLVALGAAFAGEGVEGGLGLGEALGSEAGKFSDFGLRKAVCGNIQRATRRVSAEGEGAAEGLMEWAGRRRRRLA